MMLISCSNFFNTTGALNCKNARLEVLKGLELWSVGYCKRLTIQRAVNGIMAEVVGVLTMVEIFRCCDGRSGYHFHLYHYQHLNHGQEPWSSG